MLAPLLFSFAILDGSLGAHALGRYAPRDGVEIRGERRPRLSQATAGSVGPRALPGSEALATSKSTLRVSVDSEGRQGDSVSFVPALSTDGRFVAFVSVAANLVTGDTNGVADVFVHDRGTGATERVSVSSSGVQGNANSLGPAISGDGRYVVFRSLASNLVAGDANGASDVFLHDRRTGITERVSATPGGADANGASSYPTITPNGRYVAFESAASNLVAGDADVHYDAFRYDRQTGTTVLASVDPVGGPAFGDCFGPSISSDGRFVAFSGYPGGLIPFDVFVRDLQAGTTEQVSVDPSGNDLDPESGPVFDAAVTSISADGRFVLFQSRAGDLVAGDTNGLLDVFVRDRQAAATRRVSVGSGGVEGVAESGLTYSPRCLSSDGRFAVFESEASNLVPGDTNGVADVFVHDLSIGRTNRVSVDSSGAEADDVSLRPAISGDGLVIAFESPATNLVAGDVNGLHDVFVTEAIVDCPPIVSTCQPKTNSLGCVPAIGSSGVPSLGGTDAFFVTSADVLNNKHGWFFWSHGSASVPFHGGTLCVAQPFVRSGVLDSGGNAGPLDCSGAYSFHFGQAYMASHGLTSGTTLFGQFLGRDPGFATPDQLEMTEALQFTTCP